MFFVSSRSILVVLCLGQLTAACSSFDEDTPDHLDFALPSVAWTISGDDSQWRAAPPPGTLPSFVCGGPHALSNNCCAAPFDCQRYPLACDPTTNFCALTFDVEQVQTVDFVASAGTVIRGRVFSKVELLDLATTVASDDMPLRSAMLYAGPQELPSASDPAATFLAQVSLAPGEQSLVLDEAAEATLLSLVRNYQMPFALLLAVHVVVPSESEQPGTFEVALKGSFRALY